MNIRKSWRALLTSLLLALSLATHSATVIRARASSAAPQEVVAAAGDAAAKITEEEAQEAREFTERFVRRMQETNDLTPLVGEMFVSDYAARLRQEALGRSLPLLSKSAVEQASREEVLRYQVAFNNNMYLVGMFLLAYKTAHPEEADGEDEGLAYYRTLIPPDILEMYMNDPVLKVLFEDETPAQGDSSGAEGESAGAENQVETPDDEPIRSAGQLRRFTSTLEQSAVLARKHLAASPRKLNWQDRHEGANEEEKWAAERETWKPRAWTLDREFFGHPAGTRIFCVEVLLYHMDLIRVDGKLKVLALYADMD